MDYVTILKNTDVSIRSAALFNQQNVFCISVTKDYVADLEDANRGRFLGPSHDAVYGDRTLPLGNSSNWEISSVHGFARTTDAREVARFVVELSQQPLILPHLKKEISAVHALRSGGGSKRRASFHGISRIRVAEGLHLQKLAFIIDLRCHDSLTDYTRIFSFIRRENELKNNLFKSYTAGLM